MVNKARGEVEIELNGKIWTGRLEYEDIAAIEAGTGRGLIDIARSLETKTFRTVDIVAVLHSAIKDRPRPSVGTVGEWCRDKGVIKCADYAYELVIPALTGGVEDSGGAEDAADAGESTATSQSTTT